MQTTQPTINKTKKGSKTAARGNFILNISTLISIAVAFIVAVLSYYAMSGKKSQLKTEQEKLITAEELKLCDGSRDCLYVCIVGRVYDVKRGAKFYGPGQGYHGFAGKDASRAFVTGDFSEQGLIDNLSGLSNGKLLSLKNWMEFYEKNYVFVSKLIGTFYDKQGSPTPALFDFEAKLKTAEDEKKQRDKEKLKFPPCNSEWRKNEGTRVWCSKESGGVKREWTGVPRQRFTPGKDTPVCVCVQADTEAEASASLRQYPGCDEAATVCKILE